MTVPAGTGSDDPNQFGTVPFYASIGKAFVTMCAVIPVLFGVELLDQALHHRLDYDGGIRPRSLDGLDGVIFAPFLHANFLHLYGNSVPLILTGTFVLAGGGKRFLGVTAFIAVISGLGVWLFAPVNSVTIGASGVIFGYLGYLFARGIVEHSWWTISVALLVGLLYGWQISGVVPGDETISWQAHLFGLLGGLIAAFVFRRRKPRSAASGDPLLPPTPTVPLSSG